MAHKQPHIQKLLEDRYYLRNSEGTLLEDDPGQMFNRVANAVARAEKEEDRVAWGNKFYGLMNDNMFLPNTPLLINAGKNKPGCFSACFVLPVEDSMIGIFDAVKQSAIIMKAGGGVGYSFGRLREKGAIVKSTGHKASGPVSFMSAFDAMIDTVAQGGTRRGAAIAVLPVWHPDIEEFIEMKDGGGFSNFNISVGITDIFMEAVEKDENWYLVSPQKLNFPGSEIGPKDIKFISARKLWNKIVEHAWKPGDPGLFFLDTVNKAHPLEEDIESPNPCGEIPLRPYESCNLGSINLMAYCKAVNWNVDDRVDFNNVKYGLDFDALAEDIPTMVRFLDDVIEVNPFPLPEIDKASKESRKIGLGIMGWADFLIKMKIPYDSQEALDLAEKLMGFIYETAEAASWDLAAEKGVYPLAGDGEQDGKRNATLLTVAPTGTISRIAGVSSGIEPIFAWETHHKLVDLEYDETHWALTEWKNQGIDHNIGSLVEPFFAYMKTANEISWRGHLLMQAAFQKYVDNSISKTINLRSEANAEEVSKIYRWAWELGLKGITIYRDNCKENQPLNKINDFEKIKGLYPDSIPDSIKVAQDNFLQTGEMLPLPEATITITNTPPISYSLPAEFSTYRKRGPVAVGVTHKVDTGKGKIYITINYSEYHNEPVEVFIRLGHLSTSTEAALAEWSGRLISMLLKYNVPLDSIIRQGNKVYGDTTFWYNQQSFCSFPKLISHLLSYSFEEAMDMAEMDFESMMENGGEETSNEEEEPVLFTEESGLFKLLTEEEGYCYNCGNYAIIGEGGCRVCQNCGFEECG